MIRESKRNNAQYRQHAFEFLAKFVEHSQGVDWYDKSFAVVGPVLEELLDDSDRMDVDISTSGQRSSKAV
jgi:hypothetical protein